MREHDITQPPRAAQGTWSPTPGWQRAFLETAAFEALVRGPAGGGKTWALLHAALRDIDRADFAGLLLRRTEDELRSLIRYTGIIYGALGARYVRHDLTWVFPSGARIVLAHLPDVASLIQWRGYTFQYLGIDAISAFDQGTYEGICARVRVGRSMIPLRVRVAHSGPGEVAPWVAARWSNWLTSGFDAGVIVDRRTAFTTSLEPNPHLHLEDGPGGP